MSYGDLGLNWWPDVAVTPATKVDPRNILELSYNNTVALRYFLTTGLSSDAAIKAACSLVRYNQSLPTRTIVKGLLEHVRDECKQRCLSNASKLPYAYRYNLTMLIYTIHELYHFSYYAEFFYRRRHSVDQVIPRSLDIIVDLSNRSSQ